MYCIFRTPIDARCAFTQQGATSSRVDTAQCSRSDYDWLSQKVTTIPQHIPPSLTPTGLSEVTERAYEYTAVYVPLLRAVELYVQGRCDSKKLDLRETYG